MNKMLAPLHILIEPSEEGGIDVNIIREIKDPDCSLVFFDSISISVQDLVEILICLLKDNTTYGLKMSCIDTFVQDCFQVNLNDHECINCIGQNNKDYQRYDKGFILLFSHDCFDNFPFYDTSKDNKIEYKNWKFAVKEIETLYIWAKTEGYVECLLFEPYLHNKSVHI
jgi:hypothetical protein